MAGNLCLEKALTTINIKGSRFSRLKMACQDFL